MIPETMKSWHELVSERKLDGLGLLLADDVVFHSPVVHTPQQGKGITQKYLTAAYGVLLNDSFRYVREIVGESEAVLEFVVELDSIEINGIDIIHWNDNGKIDEFKVFIRPLKAVNLVHQLMMAGLQSR